MGLVPFLGTLSMHDRLLKMVDKTPNKTAGAKIRDGIAMVVPAYLISSPYLFPNESETTKMVHSAVGFAWIAGHLRYRYYYKSESTGVTSGSNNAVVEPHLLPSMVTDFATHPSLAETVKTNFTSSDQAP